MIRTLYLARANATLVDAEGNYIFDGSLFHCFVAVVLLIQMILLGLYQPLDDVSYLSLSLFLLDRTPMHLAAERGHTATVEFLADKFKASVFDRTKDGSKQQVVG